jgi:hypothetical protein
LGGPLDSRSVTFVTLEGDALKVDRRRQSGCSS